MWVDQETDQDLVNFRGIANTIATIIMEPDLTPLTVGVHGDWGYGKSSVLRMLRTRLDEMGALTLYFNGWAFEGFEDAKVALMESIVSELIQHKRLILKAKEALVKLAKRIRWFKVARKLATIGTTLAIGDPTTLALAAVQDCTDDDGYLKAAEEDAPYHHIHGFREDFANLLRDADIKRLVVLFDDLDRCLPEHAISTLEAIRLFLSVKGATFVIGADEAMIEYAVRRHFPDLGATVGTIGTKATTFTKNYLEKLIQLPFRLPQLNVRETRRFITLLLLEEALRTVPGAFEAVLEGIRAEDSRPWQEPDIAGIVDGIEEIPTEGPVRETVKERLRIAAQIARPIADRYGGNPRQAKRFLNTLMLRASVARAYKIADDVHLPVLAKLMVLERQNPEAYSALSVLAASSSSGRIAALRDLESAAQAVGPVNELSVEQLESVFGKIGFNNIRDWLTIEPAIGETDLRPYFFVSRERLVEFLGLESLKRSQLELIEALETGQGALVASRKAQFDQLDVWEAAEVLDALLNRVRELSDISREPTSTKHLNVLTSDRPDLQMRLVVFLRSLPIKDLGAWAPARLRAIARHVDVVPEANSLIDSWSGQQENKVLAAAAKATKMLK